MTAKGLVGFGAGLTGDGVETPGEVLVERMPMGVAGLSVDGVVTTGEDEVERMPMGVAGFSEGEVVTAGEVLVERTPMGAEGLSVEGGDIKLPGVAGLGGVDGEPVGGGEDLNGDEGVPVVKLAAGFDAGAAGLDGTGDDGGGSFSVTAPAMTAGVERAAG